MSKRPDQTLSDKTGVKSKRRAGGKELLTEELAKKIALMVEQFPDSGIDVTWENVVRYTKLRFGYDFRRNVLSTKKWGDRKLIADSFHDAKKVQSRQASDTSLKYAGEPRSRLRLVIAKLQAEVLALREQLAQVRAMQYDEVHSLLDTRTPLNRLVGMRKDSDG